MDETYKYKKIGGSAANLFNFIGTRKHNLSLITDVYSTVSCYKDQRVDGYEDKSQHRAVAETHPDDVDDVVRVLGVSERVVSR